MIKKIIPLLLILFSLGCVQPLDLEVTLDDVPVYTMCVLDSTDTLENYPFMEIYPLQNTYSCDLSTTTNDIFDFYNLEMVGWTKSNSVKTEFLVALVFDKDIQGVKEIFSLTYTRLDGLNQLILVKGFSDKVLDTGWVLVG